MGGRIVNEVTGIRKFKEVYFNMGEAWEGQGWQERSSKQRSRIEELGEDLSRLGSSLRRSDTWGPGHSGGYLAWGEGELSNKEALKTLSLSE